jgi:DNA repair photolyase
MRPVHNPPNPWASTHSELLEAPPLARLEVFEEEAKSIVSSNDSPDIGFRHSINAYRGCTHACAYCYARPTHQYLGYGAGTDFDSKIVVKVNAVELLRQTFMRKSWDGDTIVFSGNTDCYQALEASYKLTRGLLETCAQFKNPVSVITKSALVRRDIDVLKDLAQNAHAHVSISCAWVDEGMARKMEPGAPPPKARFEAMQALSEAGISVSVGVAPIIPGLNDSQIPEVLKRAHDSGARKAFHTLLRLPAEVKDVFFHALKERFPTHAKKVEGQIRLTRKGDLYNSKFGERFVGSGPTWDMAKNLFDVTCAKLGMNLLAEEAGNYAVVRKLKTFQRPGEQLNLL